MPLNEERRATRRQAVVLGLTTGAYGLGFGALAVAAGLSVAQSMGLSLLMFTGGSQFALVGVIGTGGTGAAALGTATLVGVRNAFYGVEMSQRLAVRGWRRALAAQLTIDESTGVAVNHENPEVGRFGFWMTGAAVFICWNCATLLGALAGNALGDPKRFGLDAAAVAAFCGLMWPRLRDRDAVGTAVLAAFLAMVTLPLLPVGLPVVIAALAALAVGWRR